MIYVRIDTDGTRFGNWLFQYAAARTRAGDDEVAFVVKDDEAEKKVREYAAVYPDVKYVRSVPAGSVCLEGLFQDLSCIDADLVRRHLVCPQAVQEKLMAKYGELTVLSDFAAVHVRRGDYLWLPHRHPFVGAFYLREAISRLRGGHPSFRKFMVCSDDLPWCRRFFTADNFPGLTFCFAEGGSPVEDFFLMTFCGANICSNSTFSWWAAFLNRHADHRVVLPSRWYGMDIGRQPTEIYCPEVEVVACRYQFGEYLVALMRTARARLGRILRRGFMKR